ncbi:unnamed protein product [Symbiodinium sp. CCMP2592]|nr:unnamed protein product [Symbiodinium sp. CCMP2592]
MGQACQRRSREELQPKQSPMPAQAAPELVVKQHDPKRYNNDYSRFANIEDSEEEEEPQSTGVNTAEELAPPEPPEMGKMNPTQDYLPCAGFLSDMRRQSRSWGSNLGWFSW